MSSERARHSHKHDAKRQSPALLTIFLVCGIALAACVGFGNPSLWMTNEQASAKNLPDQTIDSASENEPENPVNEDASLQEEVVGEYKAISQSDNAERAVNIGLATAAIDGREIAPGETFSLNSVIGDTENDNRYQIAPVVFGSELGYARGGGICQVSTALYIAALKADMEIVERHPHSVVTDYAPIGLDATLVYGSMDLQLKNSSGAPLTIKAQSEGQTVTVTIVGVPLADHFSIDATSKIIESQDTAGDQQGSNGSNSSTTEDRYYRVESYRIYYRDGVKISSETLYTDTYAVYPSSSVMLGEGSVDPTK